MFSRLINFVNRLYKDESGQLETIIGAIAAPLIGGLFGQRAAAPAAQAADQSAQAQADMINMLMDAYKNTWYPAQQNIMNQYMGLTGAAPTQDIFTYNLMQNLLPQFMPDILRSRAQFGITRQAEKERGELDRSLAGRNIGGAAAERLRSQVGERELMAQAGLASDIGAWEAEQTIANRDKALAQALNALGLAGEYSKIGSALPGTAITGASDLTRMLAGQAQAAAAPWQNMGTSLGQALGSIFATPKPPITTPTASQQYAPSMSVPSAPYDYLYGGGTYSPVGYGWSKG